MNSESPEINAKAVKAGSQLSFFEKYLTLWVVFCILIGIILGRTFPVVAQTLDAMSIYNNSASDQTITQGTSVTLRQAGTANTGNRTLAQRGICTVLCVASNEFVITGVGVS